MFLNRPQSVVRWSPTAARSNLVSPLARVSCKIPLLTVNSTDAFAIPQLDFHPGEQKHRVL